MYSCFIAQTTTSLVDAKSRFRTVCPVKTRSPPNANRPIYMSAQVCKPSRSTPAFTYATRDSSGVPVLNVSGFSRPRIPSWLIAVLIAAVVWLLRRLAMLRHLRRKYKRSDLNKDIADFYDAHSAAWEAVWGDHMHHGLYDVVDGKKLSGSTAQIRTMSELLKMGELNTASLPPHSKVLDIGCGIGGASRYLANHFDNNCQVTGITLSPAQAERATQLNKQAGLQERVKNQVMDALNTSFPDASFDVVWSLESGEHMENKQLFISECARVLKPGGRFVMLVWCIRESNPPLRLNERFSIRRIMEAFCLPRMAPPSEYNTEMVRAGLRQVQQSDWTDRAFPFWREVVLSAAFSLKGLRQLRKNGWPLIRSAMAMRHTHAAMKSGAFRLVALTGRKPTQDEVEVEAKTAIECCSNRPLQVG